MAGKRIIKKQSLPEIIATDLRERILNGDLAEGEVIRQEVLAEEYDVSRMPVREALKRLSAEGLVSWENNRGGSVVKHSLSEIGEIFDLRTMLEVDLFRRAIPNMTEADFTTCEAILSEMEGSYDANDVGLWGKLNHRYHMALYAAAKRPMSEDFLEGLSLHSDRYVRIHLSVMQQRELAREEHRNLLEHARNQDIDKAIALLELHIQRSKTELLDMVAAQREQNSQKS